MKRSLDNMLEISESSFSSQQQQQQRNHQDHQYSNLSSVYENDRIYYNATERQSIATTWISDCDNILLLYPDQQLYGNDQKAIATNVVGLLSSKDCSSYYTINLSQKASDILLCQDVCPVFILHGIAAMLKQEPLNNGHISYYWQFVLHILKTKLAATTTTTTTTTGGKSIGIFISRLFDLVHADGLLPYEIPKNYINIITVFLHENLQFMIKQNPPKPGDNHYYTLAAEDIEKPSSITEIVVNNLFPIYFITTESHREAINISGVTSQNESIALWNKYQLDRGTMREMQLFTGKLCPVPQKKKVREALKSVRFNDVVDTIQYRSYGK